MRQFSLDDYKKMAQSFNSKSVLGKLIILKTNGDIIKLECDKNGSLLLRMVDDKLNEEEIDLLFEFNSNLIETEEGVKALFELAGINLK